MNATRTILLLLVAVLTACGSAAGFSPRPNLNVLTAEEMLAGHHSNLHDAIVALRSNWLRERPPSDYLGETPERAQVFQDGMRVGTLDYLRQLQVANVAFVRYFSVAEAATEFGRQAEASPVIAVTMKRGP